MASFPLAGGRKTGRPLMQRALPYLLVAPTLIFITMFTLRPAVQALWDSAHSRPRANQPSEFVGVQNYEDLFNERHFIGRQYTKILRNTFLFTAGTLAVSLPLALLLAILLNRRIMGTGLWRFCVFYPALQPMIGAATIWAFLFSDSIGLINAVLRSFKLGTVPWLLNRDTVLPAVVVVNIWKQTGYFMIFYLAGVQGIPRDIYEAAELDGAGIFRQFWNLTLPLLRRTTLFLLIIGVTFGFQTVEQLEVMGRGNPANRSNLLLYYIFQLRNEKLNAGHVAAMTVILALILLVFTSSNFFFFERGRQDERS